MLLALAERSKLIAPSATLAMASEAKRLKGEGVDVLDFALGEPDFKTPENIQDAAFRAIRSGQTHYTPPAGIPELRQAVADHYTHRQGLPTQAAQVVVSNGAKHSLHNALMAVTGPGEEVIIPAPYWVSYADLVKLTGATPVIVETTEAEGFKLSPAAFRAAVTPRSKLLMLNSPSNPTGVVYERRELEALADAVLETAVRCDLGRDLRAARLWRCPTDLLRDAPAGIGRADDHDFGREQDVCDDRLADRLGRRGAGGRQVHGRPAEPGDEQPLFGQPARGAGGRRRPAGIGRRDARRILPAPRLCARTNRRAAGRDLRLARRRVLCLDEYRRALRPRRSGASAITDSTEFCLTALARAHVALVMGSAFGTEGYARLSFATDLKTLERGFDALEVFLQG